jgi:hypothetical protein
MVNVKCQKTMLGKEKVLINNPKLAVKNKVVRMIVMIREPQVLEDNQ